MAALTAERDTPQVGENVRRLGNDGELTVKDTVKLWRGSLLMLDSNGEVLPGATATGQKALGRCPKTVDNADDGEKTEAEQGTFKWENSSAADEITASEIGRTCYIVDDQTVAKTDGSGTRSPAGKVVGIASDGVYVLTSFEALEEIDGAELAADSVDGTKIADDSIDSEHYVDGSIDTAHLADDAVDNDKLADDAVDSPQLADGSVDPVHLASGYRSVAADGAVTLAATDRHINLEGKTAGAEAATMTATHAGHKVTVRLATASGGGTYTFAASGGNVTLDADNEGADLVYDGSAWQVAGLTGGATHA